MYETAKFKEKLKLFMTILVPILITQISMYLMNVFDTVMSGHASAFDLAGVAIGSSLWVPVFTGINGILLAITPIVSHLIGARDHESISAKVQQGLYIAVSLALAVLIIGFFLLNPILNLMDLEAEVRHVAKFYLIALAAGIVPLFIFNTIRCFIDALGQTRVSMFIILVALPINVVFNYIFIFGKFGLPAFGGVGAGIATAITYWIVCIIAILMAVRMSPFSSFRIFSGWKKPLAADWKEQLKIGVPIGFATFFETSIFSGVTILMSVYSTYTIAAHQAAMNFYSLLYMIPLSVGMALTIAIGFEAGAKRYQAAKTYAAIGLFSGVLIAVIVGVILLAASGEVASWYNTDPKVVAMTRHFLLYAIILQLADAFGAPLQGALRGYKDVNATLYMALVSYWVIGLPAGWLLARYADLGPSGYWIGLILGLSAGTLALFFRLGRVQKRIKKKYESI